MAPCPSCGSTTAPEPGFLEDRGESSGGFVRWVEGKLERGPFGGAKRFGRNRRVIEARRCTMCGLLTLYAGNYV